MKMLLNKIEVFGLIGSILIVSILFLSDSSKQNINDDTTNVVSITTPTPFITPEILIPNDRKLKANEVIKILSLLKDFESETEEKYNFVQAKTKELWVNLEIGHPKPESGWSSWKLEKESDYYPGSFNELSLEDIDIFDSPGKEKVLKMNEGFYNYRYLIFDKDGNYLDQLGYFWQKYSDVKFKPILIGSVPYLAIEHMIGGGSGTETDVTSIYQLNNNRKIKRVLGNVLWDSFGEPIVKDLKDGTKILGREEFESEIVETGYINNLPYIKIKYVSTYVPYSRSDKYYENIVGFIEGDREKYSTREEHTVLFTYNSESDKFITSDIAYKNLINSRFSEDTLSFTIANANTN